MVFVVTMGLRLQRLAGRVQASGQTPGKNSQSKVASEQANQCDLIAALENSACSLLPVTVRRCCDSTLATCFGRNRQRAFAFSHRLLASAPAQLVSTLQYDRFFDPAEYFHLQQR
jgi:hypothetical protein